MTPVLVLIICVNLVYSQPCTPNTNCTIKCTASYGNDGVCNSIINGSTASFLSVECSHCNDKTIICPKGGCNIICSGTYGCQGSTIEADTTQSPTNNINVFCKGHSDCQDLTLNAPFSNNVFIDCSIDWPPSSGTYVICDEMKVNVSNVNTFSLSCKSRFDSFSYNERDYACNDIEINAQNAQNVHIHAERAMAIYTSTIQANNAGNVFLTSYGQRSFYKSDLYANNADLSMNCSSNLGDGDKDGACLMSSYWFGSYLNLECGGRGCQRLGTFYTNGTVQEAKMLFSVNGCNQCQSMPDCLDKLQIYCENRQFNDRYGWDFDDGDECSGNICGCQSLTDPSAFISDSAAEICLDTFFAEDSVSDGQGSSGVLLAVGIVAGVVVCFVVVVCIYRGRSRKGTNALDVRKDEDVHRVGKVSTKFTTKRVEYADTQPIVASAPQLSVPQEYEEELPSYSEVQPPAYGDEEVGQTQTSDVYM